MTRRGQPNPGARRHAGAGERASGASREQFPGPPPKPQPSTLPHAYVPIAGNHYDLHLKPVCEVCRRSVADPIHAQEGGMPMERVTPSAARTRNRMRMRTSGGGFRYWCEACGRECTAGTKAGPATTDTDDVTRCNQCHAEAGARSAKLRDGAPELLEALVDIGVCLDDCQCGTPAECPRCKALRRRGAILMKLGRS